MVLSVGLTSLTAIGWIAFAVGISVVGISLLAQLDTRRSGAQRLMDAAMVATAGTLIGVSVIFAGATAMWLIFALALGLAGLAFAGLTVHEVETWRDTRDLRALHWLAPEAVPAQRETGHESGYESKKYEEAKRESLQAH